MIPNREGIIVSPTEPTTNRRKVWMQKGEKNLIDPKSFNNFTAGIQFIPFNVKPNTDYTLSSNIPVSGVSANLFLSTTTDTSNVSSSANGVFPGEPRTINSSSNTTIYVGYRDADNVLTNEANNYWYQLEQNSTATDYEEYIEPKTYILNDNNVYEEFMKKEEISYNLKNKQTNNTQGSWRPIQLDDNENFIVFIIKGSNYEDCRTIPKELVKKYSASSPLILKFNNTIIAQLAWNSGNMVEYIWTSGYTIEHYAY